MSITDSNGQGGTRMVPVMGIIREGSESNFRSHLIGLAIEGKLSVYIAVPDDKIVYTENPNGRRKRVLPLAETQALRREILHHKKSGRQFIAFPMECRDVKFLLLDTAHAKAISDSGHADIHWFSGVLTKHPDAALSRLDRVAYEPAPSRIFCLRPYKLLEENPRGFHSNKVPPFRLVPENIIKIEFKDLFVVESDVSRLQSPPTSPGIGDDPHGLAERSPGIYALYLAARTFYEKSRRRSGYKHSNTDIAGWLHINCPTKNAVSSRRIFNGETSKNLAWLANLDHNRNRGRRKENSPAQLRTELIPDYSITYRDEPFISEALALVIYLSNLWHAELKNDPNPKVKIEQKIVDAGFNRKGEKEAVAKIIRWKR
jgi:hypothetical protein